jgi:glycosyltransferase involved in cell wall biosynthesis
MTENCSIVIPIFNEEEILEARIRTLAIELKNYFKEFEIILTENGSRDNTKEIVRKLAQEVNVVVAEIDEGAADYGQALINGINRAKFEYINIFELDYLDMVFLEKANNLLSEYDLVIGSKELSQGMDQRPFKRKIFTWLYNFGLRTAFNLKLTETHGLKALKKSKLNHITNGCVTRHAVWPSEFCIRASRDKNLTVKEIPLSMPIREIRTTRIKAIKRLKKTLDDILLLRRSINN